MLGHYDAKAILKYLKQLPKFKNAEELATALEAPRTKEQDLLFWICRMYDHIFVRVEDEYLIPRFPPDVLQFVGAKQPNEERYQKYLGKLKKKSGQSIPLFHGTSLCNLHSILKDGFLASRRDARHGVGNFMAEEPVTSYHCAHWSSNVCQRPELYYNCMKKTLDLDCSPILLGCQVAGTGRLVKDKSESIGPVHVITNLSAIVVRYVFVLPYSENSREKSALPQAYKTIVRLEEM
jgi:hypothetical protein